MTGHEAFSVLAVFGSKFTEELSAEQIVGLPIEYCFASEIKALLSDGALKVIGSVATNVPPIPAFRMGTLIIEDGEKRSVRGYFRGFEDMPIFMGIPSSAVIQRLENNWQPRDDFMSTERSYERRGLKFMRNSLFWVCFDDEAEAETAIQLLAAAGFEAERVKFEFVPSIVQVHAKKYLCDDLVESRTVFERVDEEFHKIAQQTNGKNIQYMVE